MIGQNDLATALRQDLLDHGGRHHLGGYNGLTEFLAGVDQLLNHGGAHPEGMDHAVSFVSLFFSLSAYIIQTRGEVTHLVRTFGA